MLSRRSVVVVAALALTGLVTFSGASAAPAPRVDAAGYPTTLPPQQGGSDDGVLTDGQTTIRKAKTVVSIPLTLQRAYANEKFEIKHQILYGHTRAWAVTHIGKHPRFGYFPVTHSAVLGFGAVPITADLHLQQVVEAGQIKAITVESKTQTVFPFKAYPTIVTATVDARIANVHVDQVPLDVGPDCHTVVPLTLRVVGLAPAYNLFTGGPLRGKVTIPPFTGCGANGDNLDPLLTGTISGPGNEVVLHQGNLAPWDTSQRNDCGACGPPK